MDNSHPAIDDKKCDSCGSCIEVCPMKVFGKDDGRIIVKKPDDCIGCRACEVQCQKNAIKVIIKENTEINEEKKE